MGFGTPGVPSPIFGDPTFLIFLILILLMLSTPGRVYSE